MTRTVDLVVAGADEDRCEVAEDALRRGLRVLVVLRSGDRRRAGRLRRRLRAAQADGSRAIVLPHTEVVCADGVGGVEAVVLRDIRTGRLRAINATALRPAGDGSAQTPG